MFQSKELQRQSAGVVSLGIFATVFDHEVTNLWVFVVSSAQQVGHVFCFQSGWLQGHYAVPPGHLSGPKPF